MSTQPTPDPEENPDQQWTAVSREEPARPPLPSFVKFGGLALLAVMVIAAVLIGVALGGGFTPATPSPSASPTPAYPLELPVQVGDLVRGDVTESQGPAPENQQIVRADYSDGTSRVVVLVTFPERTITQFLEDAGVAMNDTSGQVLVSDGIYCGTSADTGLEACGIVQDSTGLLVLPTTETHQSAEDLVAAFDEALTS